ncbi:MAG TPA: tetratricopeptide repeat protein, partial [Opitutaceae bacterium]
MPSPFVRALRLVCLLSLLVNLLTTAARADLVWSPQTGWRIEGGVISGLSGTEGRNALEMMNKARAAEEKGSVRGPMKTYEKVGKRYPNSVYAPEAYYRAAKLRLKRKQYFKAFEDFQNVVGRYPNTPRF